MHYGMIGFVLTLVCVFPQAYMLTAHTWLNTTPAINNI